MLIRKLKSIVSSLDEVASLVQAIEPLADGATLAEVRVVATRAEALVLSLVPKESKARAPVLAAFEILVAGIDVAHEGATGEEFSVLLTAVESLRSAITNK